VRGVYLGASTILNGFTVSGGAIYPLGENYAYGGGIWAAPNAVVTNCWIENNQTSLDGGGFGGGIYGGMVYDSRLATNLAMSGGGAHSSVLFDCLIAGNRAQNYYAYGGGALGCTLYRCTLVANGAGGGGTSGGGATGGKLYNCVLKNNGAAAGGGASLAELFHCTVVDNHASGGRLGNIAGGTYRCTNWNTIVYYNVCSPVGSSTPPDPSWQNHYQSTFNFSCTTLPPTNGVANIDSEPMFADLSAGDFRLTVGSPCIDAGTNLTPPITTDLNLDPRPLDGNQDGLARPDIGAYEASTNAATLFRIIVAAPGPPVTVSFITWTNRLYALESRPNLSGAAWTPVPGQSDIPGNGALLTLVDTNSSPPAYYRVSIRSP